MQTLTISIKKNNDDLVKILQFVMPACAGMTEKGKNRLFTIASNLRRFISLTFSTIGNHHAESIVKQNQRGIQ